MPQMLPGSSTSDLTILFISIKIDITYRCPVSSCQLFPQMTPPNEVGTKMAPSVHTSRIWKFFLLGAFVHILYLAAIFDVYFKSPLVQDLQPLPVSTKAPAKRLVLFIADGLRADLFYKVSKEFPKSRAPFLRDIIEKRGSWGVSHSKVPTETRPGHVAVIAGFFEDVSAITKGMLLPSLPY